MGEKRLVCAPAIPFRVETIAFGKSSATLPINTVLYCTVCCYRRLGLPVCGINAALTGLWMSVKIFFLLDSTLLCQPVRRRLTSSAMAGNGINSFVGSSALPLPIMLDFPIKVLFEEVLAHDFGVDCWA